MSTRWPYAAAGAVLVALSTVVPLWWAPFAVGVTIGVTTTLRREPASLAVVCAVAAGLAGWAVPVLLQVVQGQPVLATAGVAAALAGLPASGWLVVAAAALVVTVQALAGAWTGRALAGAVHPVRRPNTRLTGADGSS